VLAHPPTADCARYDSREVAVQRHEMIDAPCDVLGRALGRKGMSGAFDEAVTTSVQHQRTTPEILIDLLRAEAAHRHAAWRVASAGER